jgi:hypothetical protein
MRLTFDYSWSMLEDTERAVFRGLCVFRGAFTRQAAETIGGAGAAELRRLADKSLLMPQSGKTYTIHELLRQFGQILPHLHAHRLQAAGFRKTLEQAGYEGIGLANQADTVHRSVRD